VDTFATRGFKFHMRKYAQCGSRLAEIHIVYDVMSFWSSQESAVVIIQPCKTQTHLPLQVQG